MRLSTKRTRDARETQTPRVLFACEWMPDYRVGFFTLLNEALGERGIGLDVSYGDAPAEISRRQTSARLAWGIHRPNHVLSVGKRSLIWQPVRDEALRSSLVIVDQASRLSLNYWLLAAQRRGRARVALWGHGENLNQATSWWFGEAIKRRASLLPHWWFAYTKGTQDRVEALGYPPERITNTQNAGSTTTLRALARRPRSGA